MDKHEIFCDCGAKFEFPTNEWGCSDKNPEGFPTYEQAQEVAVERWNSREVEHDMISRKALLEAFSGDGFFCLNQSLDAVLKKFLL
jgi:hypothetical protein